MQRALKILLVAAIIGPLVAAVVFFISLIAFSGDVAGVVGAAGTRHLSGVFQFVLLASYLLIVPHILFFGLVAAIVHMLRHRVDSVSFWPQARWALIIYVCTLSVKVNAGDMRFSHRLLFLFSLFVAWTVVWFLTRRWHRPLSRHFAPENTVIEARHDR